MIQTPEPVLLAKMQKIAMQVLSVSEPRSTVTAAAAELVLEQVSLASPKLRRQLIDDHLAALDFLLSDCFKSQAPTATFSMETVPQDLAGAASAAPSPNGRIAYRDRVQALLAAAKDIMPEALAHAFNWGYLAGEADGNPRPASAEFADLANPFMNVRGDFTP